MREDYQEQLDKMFPRGYVIVYTNPDCSIRVNMFNPEYHEVITNYRDLIETKNVNEKED